MAELSGALVASDERALLERHRASIAHRADEIGIDALTAEAYPEDALSDELSSHRQTKLETNKIKFPDALITYRDEDILAVEVERTRSGTKWPRCPRGGSSPQRISGALYAKPTPATC